MQNVLTEVDDDLEGITLSELIALVGALRHRVERLETAVSGAGAVLNVNNWPRG